MKDLHSLLGAAGFYNRGYHKLLVHHSVDAFGHEMAHANGMNRVWAISKRSHHGLFHPFLENMEISNVDAYVFGLNQGNCEVDGTHSVGCLCEGCAGKEIEV